MSLGEQFLSLENFQQAWEKVAKKKGGSGIDGETITDFADCWEAKLLALKQAVANSTYIPCPCKQTLIPKGKGSHRELKIPTVRDRVVQQALLNVLSPLAEKKFSSASFAYRSNLSYLNAVEQVAHWRDLGYRWVLNADIQKYFDSIDHSLLLKQVRKYFDHAGILWLVKAWISVGVATDQAVIPAEKGIPQGAVISPLLANLYLNEFDHKISNSEVKLVRYADDFVILAKTEKQVVEARSEVNQLLNQLRLNIHPTKTQITSFEKGFRFLGHGFLEDAIFPLESAKEQAKRQGSKKKTFSVQENLSQAEVISSLDRASNQVFWSQEMATIYLIEPGTAVYKDNQRFVIWLPKEENKVEIPIREVERILVFGNIQISTQAMNACLDSKILVLFLSTSGQYKGHLWNLAATNLETELIQFEKHRDLNFQVLLSRAIVRGKLLNSKQLLLRLNRKRKVQNVKKAIQGITSDIEAIETIDNVDSLRGYEGIGAARYFPALGNLITNANYGFSQRNRQPPTDPVNSLLSFGYTLLFNNVLSLIITEQLTPYLGHFHYGEDKKPYLAFDLMEEFRSPIVDSLVLRLINNSVFSPQDFDRVPQTGGVYLNSTARRTFLKQFERRINEQTSHPDLQSKVSYRQAIQLQIRHYKSSLFEETIYEPFLRTV
jgi:CRISPR-associated protein Cas1